LSTASFNSDPFAAIVTLLRVSACDVCLTPAAVFHFFALSFLIRSGAPISEYDMRRALGLPKLATFTLFAVDAGRVLTSPIASFHISVVHPKA